MDSHHRDCLQNFSFFDSKRMYAYTTKCHMLVNNNGMHHLIRLSSLRITIVRTNVNSCNIYQSSFMPKFQQFQTYRYIFYRSKTHTFLYHAIPLHQTFWGKIRKFIRYKFDENCKSLSYLSDYIIKQAMVGSEFQFVHQFLQACECNFMAH